MDYSLVPRSSIQSPLHCYHTVSLQRCLKGRSKTGSSTWEERARKTELIVLTDDLLCCCTGCDHADSRTPQVSCLEYTPFHTTLQAGGSSEALTIGEQGVITSSGHSQAQSACLCKSIPEQTLGGRESLPTLIWSVWGKRNNKLVHQEEAS